MHPPLFRFPTDTLLTQAFYLWADEAYAAGVDYEEAYRSAEQGAVDQADLWGTYLEDVSRWAVYPSWP